MSQARTPRVLVLGGAGMLGHAVVGNLRAHGVAGLAWTTRDGSGGLPLDACDGREGLERLFARHGPVAWVVNCVAVLHSQVDERDPASIGLAEQVNGVFPHDLAAAAAAAGARVIHVSTDGVFPADAGRCGEGTPPDPDTAYGRTKLHGEPADANVLTVRCSLVGPDPARGRGLFEWLRSRPRGSRVPGFTDHLWAGCTTLQFAELCRRLIVEELFESAVAEGPVHHFCPCAPMSKYELLDRLAHALGVAVEVAPVASGRSVTRRLDTDYRVLAEAVAHYAPPGPALRELAESAAACRDTG